MPNLITVKVDVTKLDKTRFFQGKLDRDGHAPLYADLVLIPRREPGKFGDTHIVKQSKKKDEEIEMPILGNATERGQSPSPARRERTETTTTMNGGAPSRGAAPAQQNAANDEDVPF